MVTPLLLLSGGQFDDELLTRLSVNVYDPELHRKLWGWSLTLEARDAYPIHQVYSGSIGCMRVSITL